MKRETTTYKNCSENPCNMCMPMGGIIPFKGVAGSMVILHGSQGCATYMRRHIAEHFNEPVDVASSSLNEKGTVYGGENNLKQGLDNVIKLYQPQVVGVLTTCLAETIGEDIERIAANYTLERDLDNLPIITVPTPGYGGSHAEGYWMAARGIVAKLARKTAAHQKVNVIVPHISPADIREIKRILTLMNIEYTLFPDYSETLDRPIERPYRKLPDGGTLSSDIAAMPGARATVQLGCTVEENYSPGGLLESEFGVPLYTVPIPVGLRNTDLLVETLSKISGNPVPETLRLERGRLLDCMVDSHKYNFQGRCAIFGEPELVYALVRTCEENGVFPVVVATGSKNAGFSRLVEPELAEGLAEFTVLTGTDFTTIRDKCRESEVNIAIGNSDGKYLTEREGIPLVRIGFPIHDRVGGQRMLSVGYVGTAMFLDRITNTLLENKYRSYRATMYRKYYLGKSDTVAKTDEKHRLVVND